MKRLSIALAVAGFATLALAVPALAATDHQATFSGTQTSFEWEGAPQIARGAPLYVEEVRTAIPCDSGPARQCETVLLEVTEAGRLSVRVEGLEGTGGTTDVDAYLYESDAQGTQGEAVASSGENGPDSVSVRAAKPAHYLLVADYYHAYNSGYTGVAKFTPAVAPAPPVTAPPAVTPPPAEPATDEQGKKKNKKARSCKAKAKKVKSKKKRAKAMKRCRKAKKKRG